MPQVDSAEKTIRRPMIHMVGGGACHSTSCASLPPRSEKSESFRVHTSYYCTVHITQLQSVIALPTQQ